MLDARRLQVLKAVVDTGSVTAASAALGYTASAVSQNIASLERETKTSLFEKVGRGIRPTQAGLLLAEHAGTVVAQLQEAEEALDALRAGQAGRLRLAAFATAGTGLVPKAMARFGESHPGVELQLVMAETDEALIQLRSGLVDLAVITLDDPRAEDEGPGLVYEHLLDDPYHLVLARSHPLAGRQVVDLADLAGDPWIATASARCNCMPTVSSACARAGFTPTFSIEADEFASTVGFVAAGLGVAMVPMLALGSVPESVRIRRIGGEEPSRRVYAVTRTENSDLLPASAMRQALSLSARTYLRAA